jgi:hypothetical protein
MPTILFDTYAYIKKLKAVGFTEEQAAVQVETLASLINEQLATKKDPAELEQRLATRIGEMELRLRYHITLRMGAMIAASITIIGRSGQTALIFRITKNR